MSTVTPKAASPAASSAVTSQLVRLAEKDRARIPFVLDGVEKEALEGDTLLTAILTQQRHLRSSEFSGERRAGFCLIGACQDCWVRNEDGLRMRACSTRVQAGMRVVTTPLVAPVTPFAGIAAEDAQ